MEEWNDEDENTFNITDLYLESSELGGKVHANVKKRNDAYTTFHCFSSDA